MSKKIDVIMYDKVGFKDTYSLESSPKQNNKVVNIIPNLNRKGNGSDTINYYNPNKLSNPIPDEEELPNGEELLECSIYSGGSLEDALISVGL